jgi:hypothetical protein
MQNFMAFLSIYLNLALDILPDSSLMTLIVSTVGSSMPVMMP